MALDKGTGGRKRSSKSLRREKSAEELRFENEKRSKSARKRETKRRKDDVIRGAQRRIQERHAADPFLSRVDPRPSASRNRKIDQQIASLPLFLLTGETSYRDYPGKFVRNAQEIGDQFRAIPPGVSPEERAAASRSVEAIMRGGIEAAPDLNAEILPWLNRFRVPIRRTSKAADEVADEAAPPPSSERPEVIEAIKGRPATKGAPAEPGLRSLRRQQDLKASTERAKRLNKAEEADIAAGGGQAGLLAAKSQFKGELPKLRFDALKLGLDPARADEYHDIVRASPLQRWEKIRTRDAVDKVLAGKVPQNSEMKLLEQVFGPEAVAGIRDEISLAKQIVGLGIDVLNVPRSFQATLDLSAGGRQAIVLGFVHPRLFAKHWRAQLKYVKSEDDYQKYVVQRIRNSENADLYDDMKLAITDVEDIAFREERFSSNLAETITGGKRSPVRMSGRAYTGLLTGFRADAFDTYVDALRVAGIDPRSSEGRVALKGIARFINNATGRGGDSRDFAMHLQALNATFFSPRLLASRVNMLNPYWYWKLPPPARKQALTAATAYFGALATTLFLVDKSGLADIEKDPRSADFGKIRIGNTRFDLGAGFSQVVILYARLVKSELKDPNGVIKDKTRWDLGSRFFEGKLSPPGHYAHGWWSGRTFGYDEFDPAKEAGKAFIPIGAQSVHETHQEGAGVPLTAASFGLNFLGFGSATYDATEKKSSRKRRSSSSIRRSGGRKSKSLRR